jgi:hypothetical protein
MIKISSFGRSLILELHPNRAYGRYAINAIDDTQQGVIVVEDDRSHVRLLCHGRNLDPLFAYGPELNVEFFL